MHPYQNSKDNAGVTAYEIGDDYIIAEFQDGSRYLYTYQSTGKKHIDQMKVLAITGQGLTTYINQHVREHYAKKLS
jgi:hypothetical protein